MVSDPSCVSGIRSNKGNCGEPCLVSTTVHQPDPPASILTLVMVLTLDI